MVGSKQVDAGVNSMTELTTRNKGSIDTLIRVVGRFRT